MSTFTFDFDTRSEANRITVSIAQVSEVVWDMGEESESATLVMASGRTYDVTEGDAAAITRRLERYRRRAFAS